MAFFWGALVSVSFWPLPIAFKKKKKNKYILHEIKKKQGQFLLSKLTSLLQHSKPLQQNFLQFFKHFKEQCAF